MSAWTRVRYRVTQFGQWILDSMRPLDLAYARKRLPTPELVALFTRMSRADQHHSITVAQALERQGHHNPDLIAAALLHDIGKSRVRMSVWARVMVVLGEWLVPEAAHQWSRAEAKGLRRPFVVRHRHAAWGAEMTSQAGASQTTVRLIRNHHKAIDKETDAEVELRVETRRLLAALQASDDE